MEKRVDKKVKELEKEIEDAKKELRDYKINVQIPQHLPSDNGIICELHKKIRKYELKLNDYLVKREMKPIQSYFDSIKEELSFDEENSSLDITITMYKDLRYAKFDFRHYNGKVEKKGTYPFTIDWQCYDSINGKVVYDTNGNILLNKTKIGNGKSDPKIIEKNYNLIDSEIIEKNLSSFLDDEYIIIHEHYRDTELYKLNNGKYEVIHTFSRNKGEHVKVEHTPSLWAEGILIHDKRLYDVNKDEYLTNIDFDFLKAYDSDSLPKVIDWNNNEIEKEYEERTRAKLKNNNLLLATKKIIVRHMDKRDEANTFCYLDTTGTITGKLHVIIDGKMINLDVTNETYNIVIEELKEIMKKKIERKVISEKKAKIRKENQMTKKKRQLLETIMQTKDEDK